MHAGLSRRAPSLPTVARDAAGDDVFPVLAAALGHRHDVVEGQLRRGKRPGAVLAGVTVARINVHARERHVVEFALDTYEAEEADDGGELEADARTPHLAVVDREHLHLLLAPERNRLLPVDHLQWFVRSVQKERLLHIVVMMPGAPVSCQGTMPF